MSQCIYIWGQIPKGLNMEMHSQTNLIPREFTVIQPYNFSSIHINTDFAIGVSHAVKVTFELPNNEGNYGAGGKEF